jgi:hypothetical protein
MVKISPLTEETGQVSIHLVEKNDMLVPVSQLNE